MNEHQQQPQLRRVELMFISPTRLAFLYILFGIVGTASLFVDALIRDDGWTASTTVLRLIAGAVLGWVAGLLTASLINAWMFIFKKGLIFMIRDVDDTPSSSSPHGRLLARYSRRTVLQKDDAIPDESEELIIHQ